jgi:hypothetical protein
MDPNVVAIAPHVLVQFGEIYRTINRLSDAPARPEKTLRRVLRHARELEPEMKDALGEPEHLSIYLMDRYLFAVGGLGKTQTVVSVADAVFFPGLREVRKERALRLKRQRARENRELGLKWDTPLSTVPPIDLDKVVFTNHALDRFSERFPAHARGDAERAARELLAQSTEENAITRENAVRRLIDSKFRPARYFRLGKLRFILSEEQDNGMFVVITIEKAYLR